MPDVSCSFVLVRLPQLDLCNSVCVPDVRIICTRFSAPRCLRLIRFTTSLVVQTRGVQVTEVWGIDGELPTSPMGTTDRAAAACLPLRVSLYDVHPQSSALTIRC